jgi:EAL domain-containing protein (putative c-di-GMP-specific phosphodiesterase class I)
VFSIKIDRSFITHIPTDTNSMAIVSAIIAMAHSLNIKTIAEGVETQEQLDFLRSKDCDRYQGFFFSEAVSAEDLEKLLTP